MKKYWQCGKVYIVSGVCAILTILLLTFVFGEKSLFPYLSGVLLFLLLTLMIPAILCMRDRTLDPKADKYVRGRRLLNEPVRVETVLGERVRKNARLILTDQCVWILLENEGYRFPIEEDHSFIYIHKEKKILLAKNGSDLQITAGDFLNNLPIIANAIEKAGFRISQREHAPY